MENFGKNREIFEKIGNILDKVVKINKKERNLENLREIDKNEGNLRKNGKNTIGEKCEKCDLKNTGIIGKN